MSPILEVSHLSKQFTLHQQQGVVLQVLHDVSFSVQPGECVVLAGQSGAGKSTLMRTLYGNYQAEHGSILVRHHDSAVELVQADPRLIMQLRKQTVGYVSQFLRVIPRVSCLDVVMEPALLRGEPSYKAQARAEQLLTRLNIPQRLWSLAPGTFSGGEQQRVNIARGFMVFWPLLLLDEPTASLDDKNRQVVLALINEAKQAGSAIVGIFHDAVAREAVMDRYVELNVQESSHVA
ncbi:phosphonate C-P lyase system protein PhnL [Paenalcaligenes suwonensis]|uniref:phosphonate C-P lyase system protein PhnL n=1 Tax=Paenalcaligenes suwonensis TaxID=1202713 RepID=UPI00140A133B|nr:phosphonate C-P lyase system protein PhnL [Paenalcaligenes suwonensis]NHC61057.1 phosphonate C-P lyase system protein PhnL [Paenalcaligenes suwonensis]